MHNSFIFVKSRYREISFNCIIVHAHAGGDINFSRSSSARMMDTGSGGWLSNHRQIFFPLVHERPIAEGGVLRQKSGDFSSIVGEQTSSLRLFLLLSFLSWRFNELGTRRCLRDISRFAWIRRGRNELHVTRRAVFVCRAVQFIQTVVFRFAGFRMVKTKSIFNWI